jgi:hypothetical protein
MRVRPRSIVRGTLVATTMSLLLAACGGGNGSNSPNTALTPTEVSQTPTASMGATLGADTIVGGWERARTCQELARALTRAGLGDFAAEWVGGYSLLTTPENVHAMDPKHPCADAAEPREFTFKFWEDGTYNVYDQDGRAIDGGEYASVDLDTILFAGFNVDYKIEGDTIVFSLLRPESCKSERCRTLAAYATAGLLPGLTWERVS